MITTQTPFRISFFGGGSDISGFYSRHPGAVLSVAINKSMYLTTHPYFEPTRHTPQVFEDRACALGRPDRASNPARRS